MSEKSTKPASTLDGAVKALRAHLLEQGNRFDRGPAYEGNGKVLASIKQAVRMYEGLGYTKLLEFGIPPVYALMQRGHREAHLFQPQDPQIRQWLEDERVNLNDPVIRDYQMRRFGLGDSDVSAAGKPHRFHINEVDDVFIATADDVD
ncbi:MAG: hypothetical protein KDJ54_14340 [Candidatus Competibacteraceae bacterium]|nr:hypothetical protein [Candidatus Competibacteraceae bacterium]